MKLQYLDFRFGMNKKTASNKENIAHAHASMTNTSLNTQFKTLPYHLSPKRDSFKYHHHYSKHC